MWGICVNHSVETEQKDAENIGHWWTVAHNHHVKIPFGYVFAKATKKKINHQDDASHFWTRLVVCVPNHSKEKKKEFSHVNPTCGQCGIHNDSLTRFECTNHWFRTFSLTLSLFSHKWTNIGFKTTCPDPHDLPAKRKIKYLEQRAGVFFCGCRPIMLDHWQW